MKIHRSLIIGGLQCWKFLSLFLHHWEITMEMKTLVTLHLVSIFSFYLQALIQSKLIGIYLGFFASIKNILKKYWILCRECSLVIWQNCYLGSLHVPLKCLCMEQYFCFLTNHKTEKPCCGNTIILQVQMLLSSNPIL